MQQSPIITNSKLAEFIYKNRNNLCPYFAETLFKMTNIDPMYTSEEHIRIALDSASVDLDKYVKMCFNKGKVLKGVHGNSQIPQQNSQRKIKKRRRYS